MFKKIALKKCCFAEMTECSYTGQGSPIKLSTPSTPSKVTASGVELRDDIVKYYKDNGLDSFAKEVMWPGCCAFCPLFLSVVWCVCKACTATLLILHRFM